MDEATQNVNIFGQVIPGQELFHYTSMEGLKGVVAGKTLWATNIEFLNDTTEFRHGEKVVQAVVKTRKRSANGDRNEFFDQLENYPSIFEAEDVFLVSLSEAGDLLSQWRGYAPNGGGYSIGFDSEMLAHVGQATDQMHLVRCLYNKDQQKDLVRYVLDGCLNHWKSRHQERQATGNRREFSFSPVLAFRVYATFLAASFKNASFAEEREWRLLGVCSDPKRFCFRSGQSTLTPYIELRWGWETKAPDSQPIASVTVGPCPNPVLSQKSVRRLLAANGAEGVHVKNSEIPFRAW